MATARFNSTTGDGSTRDSTLYKATICKTASSRSGNSAVEGTSYGIHASRIFDFARTMRWACVGAPIRKARPISSVVSRIGPGQHEPFGRHAFHDLADDPDGAFLVASDVRPF